MKITFSDADGTIDEIREEAVQALIAHLKEEIGLVSPMQACGMLDLTPKALGALGLDKVDVMGNGRAIRYKVADIKTLIAERTIKALPKGKTRRKRRAA